MPSSQTRVVVVKKAGRGEVCENHTDHTNDEATSSAQRGHHDPAARAAHERAPATMRSSGQTT